MKDSKNHKDYNYYKTVALLAALPTILMVDVYILLSDQLSTLEKSLIIGATTIGQLIGLIGVLAYKPKSKSDVSK